MKNLFSIVGRLEPGLKIGRRAADHEAKAASLEKQVAELKTALREAQRGVRNLMIDRTKKVAEIEALRAQVKGAAAQPSVDKKPLEKQLKEAKAALRESQAGVRNLMADRKKKSAEVESLRTRVQDGNKLVAKVTASDTAFRTFLSSFIESKLNEVEVGQAVVALHDRHPVLALSLAYAWKDSAHFHMAGLLALIRLQFKRKLFQYVVDLLQDYPRERIMADCFEEAARSLSLIDPQAARQLIEAFLDDPRAGAGEGDLNSRIKAALKAALVIGDPALIERVLGCAPDPSEEPVSVDSLDQLRKRAEDLLARGRLRASTQAGSPAINIGFLSYRSALHPSTNIGDYVQTIAMMGMVAKCLPDAVTFHGGGEATYQAVVGRAGPDREACEAAGPVHCYFIDRDSSTSTTPTREPVWVPVNGWFMHPQHDECYDFPFADNVRPIFLGVHINRPALLTEAAIAYFRRYGPVGTRDHHTAQILLANGVPAFFSGCPTLTLDEVFGRAADSERDGRYRGVYKPTSADKSYPNDIYHLDPTLPTMSIDDALSRAWSMLDTYSRAGAVKTPLLHCYLPCRAMGTDVVFTNLKASTDVRFEGLVGIAEADRIELKATMLGRLRRILSRVLGGATEDAVYAEWREMNAEAVRAAEDRRAIVISRAEPATERVDVRALERVCFRGGVRGGEPQRDPDAVDVAFCYDDRLERSAIATIRSVLANTRAAIRINLLTRGVGEAAIQALSARFPDNAFVWTDLSSVEFTGLTLLKHTTVSTMDRIFLPSLMDYVDRVVYLDIDIVVLGDVAELHRLPVGPSGIAGRVTILPSWGFGWSLASTIEKQLDTERLKQFRARFAYAQPLSFLCFNAGVLCLDLKTLRQNGFSATMLELIDSFGINDQFAINLFAAGEFGEIPREWNHFPTQEVISDAKLIHYIGPIKPWNAEYTPRAESWREYMQADDGIVLEKTSVKEWFN